MLIFESKLFFFSILFISVCFLREKIRNIEETDRAKRKLLQTLCEKKGVEKKMSTSVSQTPTPISILASTPVVPPTPTKPASISFVQHKRCK
jgi:hypothetical protein